MERFGAAASVGVLAVAGVFGLRRIRDRYRSTSNIVLAQALANVGLDNSVVNTIVESEGLRG